MARPKTTDGKRVTVAAKISEPTASAIDARRGPATRSQWLANAATDALDGYRHERRDNCHHAKEHLITCDEYDALRARAQGRCEICRTPEADTKRGQLVIDHYEDNTTWYVRGLLCDRCNQVMSCHDGHKPWGANRKWQQAAAEYASRPFRQPSKTSRGRKVMITYRIEEDMYASAAALAASRGDTIAAMLTRGLTAYVRGESMEEAVRRWPGVPVPLEPVQAAPEASERPRKPCRHPGVLKGPCKCGEWVSGKPVNARVAVNRYEDGEETPELYDTA